MHLRPAALSHQLSVLLVLVILQFIASSTADPSISSSTPNGVDSGCNAEFIRMYTNTCKRLKVRLHDSTTSNTSIASLLEQYLPDSRTSSAHVISIEYKDTMSRDRIGSISDAFLQRRPNWIVYHEEYSWQKHRSNHVMYIRVGGALDTTLQQMASVLNPSDCSSRPLVFKGYEDFDEYGNEHFNIADYYQTVLGSISLVHIHTYAKFIDEDYCPNEINKYKCAFLPLTYCPLPLHYTNCSEESCVPGNFVYANAQTSSKLLSTNYDNEKLNDVLPKVHIKSVSMVGDVYRSSSALDFTSVDKQKYTMDGLGSIFYTAIFLRRNFDFRSRSAKLIQNLRQSSKPVFNANDHCVAIHIRHHDRVKLGHDMLKYCQDFVRNPDGSCYNRTNNQPIEPDCGNGWDIDYGCTTAVPFGGISFGDYLKAADTLIGPNMFGNQSRTVFIMTDDGEWVKRESQPYLKNWTIHTMPAQPKHRSRATINGATLFASMELVQQCSGLVGHSLSAFTVLLRAIMCVKHGPKNNIQFGKCPKFYDFGTLSDGFSSSFEEGALSSGKAVLTAARKWVWSEFEFVKRFLEWIGLRKSAH